MHVSHFQAERPDRERALQGLHFLSPDSPWVWLLGRLAADPSSLAPVFWVSQARLCP